MVSPVRRAICRDPLYSGLLTSVTSHLQEKRIYDLKKKNQELEKFKFVLDYKIKELKKQIEPREKEIKVMKEQIQEVRSHLPHPAVPSQLPPTSWPGVKEPPHSPSLLPRRVQPPFCRGCHGEGPARGLVVQKQIALGFGLPRPAGGLRPYQHHLKVHIWALKGKPRLLGFRPPEGDVYPATSGPPQKAHPSHSTFFLWLEMLFGALCKTVVFVLHTIKNGKSSETLEQGSCIIECVFWEANRMRVKRRELRSKSSWTRASESPVRYMCPPRPLCPTQVAFPQTRDCLAASPHWAESRSSGVRD